MNLKAPYRKHPGVMLDELKGQRATCLNCNTSNEINWLGDLEFPHLSVAPHQGGGHWVSISVSVTCASCGSEILHPITPINVESKWHLYGDEAQRFFTKDGTEYSYFCISLVGLHGEKQEAFQKKLNRLKLVARPDTPPHSWVHHFMKIWGDSGEKRIYSFKDIREKIAYGKKLAQVIKKYKPYLVAFNCSSVVPLSTNKKERAGQIKRQKEDAFKMSILCSLNTVRKNEKSVEWIFDNIQDATNGERTEGWADECFLGLQYTRLFTYLAAGAHIEKPKFVVPGSHYLLEVADFISFCFAREFKLTVEGKSAEIPSGFMGNTICHLSLPNKDPISDFENGSTFIAKHSQTLSVAPIS